MEEKEIKRFGEITVLNIDYSYDCGYIRICNENECIDNMVVPIEDLIYIYLLLYRHSDYLDVKHNSNSYQFQDGYLDMSGPLTLFRFRIEDFNSLGSYLYDNNEDIMK